MPLRGAEIAAIERRLVVKITTLPFSTVSVDIYVGNLVDIAAVPYDSVPVLQLLKA